MNIKAILSEGLGGAEVLKMGEAAIARPGPQELLIRTCASGINAADLLQRRGRYPAPAGSSSLLGLEISGVVDELGAEAVKQGWRAGDRVVALLAGGGYAEKVLVRQDQVMKIPDSLDLLAAGGLAEVFLTAYLELVWLGKLRRGQRLLIHAGASGVGSAAIQLACALGAEVWVTASSEKKLGFCQEWGAHHLINYKTQDFLEVVLQQTEGVGVDCILDLVGAVHFPRNLKALAPEGTLLLVGLGGGAKAEIDLQIILAKRLKIIGSTLRSRDLDEKARLVSEFWRFARPLFEHGSLKPVIDRIFPVEQVQDAHRYLESQGNMGKILLQWPAPAP